MKESSQNPNGQSSILLPSSRRAGSEPAARSAGRAVLSPGGRMTRYLACSIAALLALATTPGSGAATTHPGDTPDVEILVNGVPQTRYAHNGRWYVEALKGREYAIRLRNPYPV